MSKKLFVDSGGKLLTFMLGRQEYGIQILEAREVVGLLSIEPVPQTPDFVKGVINLRGKIIPVIDLRTKFNMAQIERTADSCIVIVDINNQLTGIIVDSLSGVVTVPIEQYEDSPQMGHNINTEYINGMAKLGTRIVIILSMANVLSNDELESISSLEELVGQAA